MRVRHCVAFVAACLISLSTSGRAQASPYVPLDDIAYTYIDALMARGFLHELSALERPFTVSAISSGIDSAQTREPSPTVTSYLDALRKSVSKYATRPNGSDSADAQLFHARGTADLYATVQSQGRRELMVPGGKGDIRPGGDIRLVMAGGPVVAAVRTLIDSRLNVDPEFAGRKDRKINGRTEDGYASGQWKYGEIALGRLGRNWGPPALQGLMLGNYAYTYDHLYGRIGTDRIHFSTVVTRLDDIVPTTGPTIERYFSIHRLSLRVGNWELAGSESYVYAGAGRGFEPSLVNPFNIYALSWRSENQEGNLGLGGEMAFRSQRIGTYAAQLFIDDLQVDRSCNPACKQPSSYALTVTAEGIPLRGDQRAFASYTRVSNLAYNNKNPSEHYEVFGVGLGRGFSDYDEIRAGIDLAVLQRTPLRLYAAHRRQGEGSYNLPFPDPAAYASTPSIFNGVVTSLTRVAVSSATAWRDFDVSGDLGLNHSSNAGHSPGRSTTGFVGRIKLEIVPRWSVSF